MIVCPRCGSSTGVRATRSRSNYIHRRRVCENVGCNQRVSTIEVISSKSQHHGDVVVISRADLAAFQKLISSLATEATQRLLALTELNEDDDNSDDDDG